MGSLLHILAADQAKLDAIPGLLVSDLCTGSEAVRIAELLATAGEQRATIADLRVRADAALTDAAELRAKLAQAQATIAALQANDARYPLDCYGVARLVTNLSGGRIELAQIALAVGSRAEKLGEIKARDLCDELFDTLDPSGCGEDSLDAHRNAQGDAWARARGEQ